MNMSQENINQKAMQNRIDFSNTNEAKNWVIVNDTVMGGRSKAQLTVDDNRLIFAGDLSLENNGGFASTRRIYDPVSWDSKRAIVIKVVGDGRSYQFRLRTNRNMDGVAYVANFKTQKDTAHTIRFELKDFSAQFRGRLVRGAPALQFSDVAQMGFMLADKNPGSFVLQIEHIEQVKEVI